jgi:ArsR family transcriptional regulator
VSSVIQADHASRLLPGLFFLRGVAPALISPRVGYNLGMEILKTLRILGDVVRLRILRLLAAEELSVAELQEILGMGQSRISMQLSQLKQAGFVELRRVGQKSLYHTTLPPDAQSLVSEILERSTAEIPEAAHDDEGLKLILQRRKDHLRAYFDELAGRFGRSYVPGRSWKGLAEILLRLLPPLVVADVGAGEGTLSLLLARSAERVIAVDSSERMVEYGAGLAERNGIANLEYRLGDMEDLPIDSGSVDMVLMHQTLHHALHPKRAVGEAWRVLRPGGRIVVLDLLRHDFESARELYADVWLGFSQVDILELLEGAGFRNVSVSVVDREAEPPHFETLMAIGVKNA